MYFCRYARCLDDIVEVVDDSTKDVSKKKIEIHGALDMHYETEKGRID